MGSYITSSNMRPHVHKLIHFRSVLVLFSVHENAIENKSHLDLKLMNFNIKALICAHFCFKPIAYHDTSVILKLLLPCLCTSLKRRRKNVILTGNFEMAHILYFFLEMMYTKKDISQKLKL